MQFNGLTPLGTNLNKKVIQPFLAAGINKHDLAKPILVRLLCLLLRVQGSSCSVGNHLRTRPDICSATCKLLSHLTRTVLL